MADSCSVEECSVHFERAQNLHLRQHGYFSFTGGMLPRLRDLGQSAKGLALALGVVFLPFPWRCDMFSSACATYAIDQVNQHLFKKREDRFRSVLGVVDPLPPPLQRSGFKCGLGADGVASNLFLICFPLMPMYRYITGTAVEKNTDDLYVNIHIASMLPFETESSRFYPESSHLRRVPEGHN